MVNYSVSRLIQDRNSRLYLVIGIVANTALIFYYKYFNFFTQTINGVFKTDFVMKNIVLPLGISFFTFQQISFLVDSYKGKTRDYSFIEYALFVAFFPQLIAGPIVLHNEMIPQFRDSAKKKINADNLYSGVVLFTLGLAKKVLLADLFAKSVEWAFAGNIDSLTSLEIFIVMLSYTFQIYFDFSAYSDMATGIARMFNFSLPMNFNSPYKAMSIPDFWGRWHMTLTRFLRTYIYFPLGGSRCSALKTYRNIRGFISLCGLSSSLGYTPYPCSA